MTILLIATMIISAGGYVVKTEIDNSHTAIYKSVNGKLVKI